MKQLLSAAAFCAVLLLHGAMTARWSERDLTRGDAIELIISSESQEPVEFLDPLPAFLKGGSTRSSVQILNGQVSALTSYAFTVEAEGEVVIPPLRLRQGSESVTTPEWPLKVKSPEILLTGRPRDPDRKPELSELVFGRVLLPDERTEYYVGEEIAVRLELLTSSALRIRLYEYPSIDAGKALFADSGNREDSRFTVRGPSARRVDGEDFESYLFAARFRALAPGLLQPEAAIGIQVYTTSRRPIEHRVEFPFPELTVKPLPAVPAGTEYLGLLGDYRIETAVSGSPLAAGEALTLAVTVTGEANASFDTLLRPAFEWPGCRIYPPEAEIDAAAGRAVLRYTFVPLEAGPLALPVRFAVFDPLSGEYRLSPPLEALTIAAGQRSLPAEPPAAEVTPIAGKDAVKIHSDNLYYLKLSGGTEAFPWRLILFPLLLLAGPAWFLAAWLLRRRAVRTDAATLRRKAAKARRRQILEQLERSPEKLPEIIAGEVLPCLSALYDLPPGLDAAGVAARIDDPEMSAVLRDYADRAYAPSGGADWKPLAAKAARALRRLMVIPALCLCLAAAASWDGAVQAYDDGDFARAQAGFRSVLEQDPDNAALWYNLGCCAAQTRDWARAAWRFEGADLLRPGDTATRENLNVARRRLLLPDYAPTASPVQLLTTLRDGRRPAFYAGIVLAAWSLGWILLVYRRRLGANLFRTAFGLLCLVAALALAAWISQRCGPWSGTRGLVIVRSAPLYSLPSATGGRELAVLRGGTALRVIESRQGFVNVDSAEGPGWIPEEMVGRLPR